MIELGIAVAILAGLCAVPQLWRASKRRWTRWVRGDPRVDPFADRIEAEVHDALAAVLAYAGQGARAADLSEGWALLHRGEALAAAEIFGGGQPGETGSPEALAGLAASALQVCTVSPAGWHWRAGLRQALPLAIEAAQQAPSDPEICAIEAQIRAALGELDAVGERVAQLPADHWRACLARAVLYEARGDARRAESALNAAIELAPAPVRPRLQARHAAFVEVWG